MGGQVLYDNNTITYLQNLKLLKASTKKEKMKILVACILIVTAYSYSYDNQKAREEKEQIRKELHSALKAAVIYGKIEQMERMLASGADKDGTDLDGHTALH